MAKRAQPPAVPPAPPAWREVADGADYVVGGVVVVTVRAAVSNDPRRDSWSWAAAGRTGRHVGDLDSAKARAIDQHQRHSG